MKKFSFVLLAFALMLTACENGKQMIEGEQTTQKIEQKTETDVNFYEYDFLSLYEKAEYSKFNSPASENGLADTLIYIEGTIEIFDPEYENNDIFPYILTDENNNKWLLASWNEMLLESNQKIRVFGYYMGVSSKADNLPALNVIRYQTYNSLINIEMEGIPAYIELENNISSKDDAQAEESTSSYESTAETTIKSTPEPAPETITFEPIIISGTGDSVTEVTLIPIQYTIANFKHDGRSNFIVRQYDSDFNRVGGLINEIGIYSGSKLLDSDGETIFEVSADGNWEIEIIPFASVDDAGFHGNGSKVSGIFVAPQKGVWTFTHDGKSNFIVRLYTSQGRKGIINEIGVYSGNSIIDFGNGTAFWTVEADGTWSITPQ